MFKKSNRNFRKKKASTDEDSDEQSPTKSSTANASNTATDLANFDKSNQQLIASIKNKKTLESKLTSTILSFEADLLDEEEDEITEFKVKKSKESRRIAKELKKSKKEKERQAKIDSGHVFTKSENSREREVEKELTSEDVLFAEGIKVKPLTIKKPPKAKYLVNKYQGSDDDIQDFDDYKRSDHESEDEEQRRLDSLRKDMEVLNGEEEEDEQDEAKKSMKIMLKSGIIPDATMIHEARKKREMARGQDDFIPVNSKGRYDRNKNKSRVVREEDDDDGSDEEAVVSLNYKTKARNERQRDRDAFLAYENGSDEEIPIEDNNIKYRGGGGGGDSMSEEDENEEERWEKEQIRKGVQISQPSKLGFEKNSKESSKLMQHILGANVEEFEMEIEPNINDLEMLNHLPEVSFASIKDVLNKNLDLLREKLRTQTNEHTQSIELLKANQLDYDNLKTIRPSLDKQYVYYQEMKAFVRDFVDCYEEKMTEIEDAENKWKDMLKQRAERVVSRRQQEVKDQSLECSGSMKSGGQKKTADQAHEERMRHREARREAKKKIREKKHKIQIHLASKSDTPTLPLYEGLSSDDEDGEEMDAFKQERKKIVCELNATIAEEINENFYEYELIKARFEKWNDQFGETYRNAYISLSLPKLFAPLVRCELVDWNPLDKSMMISEAESSLENTKWFNELLTYNKEELLKSLDNPDSKNPVCEDDFLIIPHIIEKTVLVKLIKLAENFYDPLSTSQTIKFSKLVSKLIYEYSTVNYKSVNTKMLIEAIVARLKKSIDNDVFVPLFPKTIIDLKTSDSSIFFHRQFWSCVKLFLNTLKWRSILADSLIKEYALDSLLNRYLMIGLQSMEADMQTLEKIDFIIGNLPVEWLDNTQDKTCLPQLVNISRIIRRIADNINQKEFEAKIIDKNTFKDHLNQIKKSLIKIGANEQAVNMMNVYDV